MQQRLQPKAALGYGIISIGEASTSQFVNSFLLLYLTSIVGMATDKASTIASVGMIFETITALVVGRMSDSCTSSKGRRRPFLFFSSFYLPAVLTLMFFNYSGIFSGTTLVAVYIFLNILFWIGRSVLYVPFIAFGAELATDYDDRTKLRSMCSAFGVVGCFLGMAAPLMAVSLFLRMKIDDSTAWFFTGAGIALCVGLSIFLGWKWTAGTEHMPEDGRFNPVGAIKDVPVILKDYWQLMKLKSMQILIVFKILFNVGYAFFTSTMVFFLQYRLNYGNEVTSTVYLMQIGVNFVTVLIMSWIGLKLGKAGTLRLSMSLAGAGCVLFYVIGINGYVSLMAFIIMFSMASNSFWQLSGAIFYDITEVDEFVYDKRREGAITSLQSGIGALATSAIIAAIGKYLKVSGFAATAAVQPQSAMVALDRLFVLMPGVCFLVGVAVLCLYPLNKKRFRSLQLALDLRKQGKDYSEYQEDLDKIL